MAGATTAFLTVAPLAYADSVTALDSDTASPGYSGLGYGNGNRDCAGLGDPVSGAITVKNNGSQHFLAGETLTVTLTPPVGVTATVDPAADLVVPAGWSRNDTMTIPFTTVVTPASPGGKVYVDVSDSRLAAVDDANGRPQFNVSVNCSAPADATAPVISYTLTQPSPDGLNGWWVTPVLVDWTVSDPESAITSSSGCDDTTVSTDTTGLALTCSATSAGGTSSVTTSTIKLDQTAPAIAGPDQNPDVFSGSEPDGTGWFKTDVGFTWTCSDATSGPVDATIVKSISGEGAGQSRSAVCQDNAGNSSDQDTSDSVNIDKTAPALNITGPANGASIDVCAAVQRPSFAPTDWLSHVNPSTVSDSWTTPTVLGLGAYSYAARADDFATNHASETRTYAANRYGAAFGGILQPVNADGSSRFKLGSTIPVKFQLLCSGTPITNAVATLKISQGDVSPDAGTDEAVSTASSTTGNLFRYDATSQQYIFNLSTKVAYGNPDGSKISSFSQGTWTLAINLGDGTYRNVKIQLVK